MQKTLWMTLLALGLRGLSAFGADAAVQNCAPIATDGGWVRKTVCIDSLSSLSVAALRSRDYGSQLKLADRLDRRPGAAVVDQHYRQLLGSKTKPSSFLASYRSDGLSVYARLDIPDTVMPTSGYPLVVFAHGWVGRKEAQDYDFGFNTTSLYGEVIRRFTDAGFAVLAPGYRGHGRVAGRSADGIAWLDAWDNGSYLMPSFYAIDVLNLLAGLESLNDLDWQSWKLATEKPRFDLNAVSLLGHSQGGDVALTVLAVSGDNPRLAVPLRAASIWSGTIADRFSQAETFGPMSSTLEAFMSGDGTWTGSAIGRDGSLNANFVFPWPSDWIGTVDTESSMWTWQKKQWSLPSVAAAVEKKYREMYDALNRYVHNGESLDFTLSHNRDGTYSIKHAAEVIRIMPGIGGFAQARHIKVPLALHISDRDYYSLPLWNHYLTRRIRASGGRANLYLYPGNNHSLKRSSQRWFSPPGTVAGISYATRRDSLLFRGEDPSRVVYPGGDARPAGIRTAGASAAVERSLATVAKPIAAERQFDDSR